MVSSGILFPLLIAAVSSIEIPVTSTQMTIYRNESTLFSSFPQCAPSNQTFTVPRSLLFPPVVSKKQSPYRIRVGALPNAAAINQIRPRAAIDMIDNAYLFLACLTMFALVNVLAIDYAYGGPLFSDDSLPEENMFFPRPIQFVRPVSLSVAAPTIAPANPIHSAKWATVNKPARKSVIPKPIAAVKPKSVSRKDGSDTEC
ncbi:hypothetical protein PRIPAC_92374 [Pristionchus pacificus]|uniref:Uncharacterized protein n=1 Tax=Pristionchus pacificus TaxID=54126 RepID=A0A2A6BQD8_PRIPA|nr:hypothetical protein PRIPAC_92374 [Pristionchus pacificus]|eukprot:PDM68097.1 hypothetical protein PRIPAC_46141 [Pristionchus pacificus]